MFVWGYAFYYIACVLTGAIVGGIQGFSNPENAAQLGAEASIKTVTAMRIYYILGAAVLAGIGGMLGILPGTERDNKKNVPAAPDSTNPA